MTVEEAITIINEMTPCANCEYRNTGCKRKDSHVWSDGFCHQVNEAIELIMEALNIPPFDSEVNDDDNEFYEPDPNENDPEEIEGEEEP